MSIELTPVGVACNLSCPYCYENPMREAGNLSPGYDVEAMKRGLAREGYAFTVFGGEPLLMKLPDLTEIFRWGYATYGRNAVQTNGSLITEDHLRIFAEYHVSVGLSLDGPDELNDSRWAGTLEKTRAATAASLWAMRRLVENGNTPSVIVTLYRGNASASRLPRLLAWLRDLDQLGIRAVRVHLLEIEREEVRAGMALTEDENVAACLAIRDLQADLAGIQFDLFADMERLLLGTGQQASCIWGACDPLTTPAVQAVNGAGGRSNCNRTNKDGVDWVKADTHGSERYVVLYETPQADGGCQGCKYFFACKGQCPGTAIDGDWRNRSEQCQIWYRLFDRIEHDLIADGQQPISSRPEAIADAERALLSGWAARRGTSPAGHPHGDHTDAPEGVRHTDAGMTVHGDSGHTTTHGDAPHQDQPHGDR